MLHFASSGAVVLSCWLACAAAAAQQGDQAASPPANSAPKRRPLPLPGEVFEVDGHTAFLIPGAGQADDGRRPWVFYAPTFPNLPGASERWLFERLVGAGIAIAGVDVGESYGSPAGRRGYDALYRELVEQRGLSSQPVLLARSRGGLMLYAWAADNPAAVAGVAGIYPVCDLRSYPGLERAAAAFDIAPEQLERDLVHHNPIARLAPLVRHGVPVFHLHGDADRRVPLADNSAALQRRYQELGGAAKVAVVVGGGHDVKAHWFEDEALLAFVLERCRLPVGSTRGIIDVHSTDCPEGGVQLVGAGGSLLVPEKPGVSNWTFADGVLTASSGWDSVLTPKPYRDFRMHVEFNVNASDKDNPEGRGNSGVYLQQRYELQILDSHGVAPEDYKASYCGSLYRLRKPDVIAARPAGTWQSYDIVFRAARFDGESKVANARITALHNGVVIHDDVEIPRKTGAGMKEGPAAQPIKLQGHANPVRFRNVWIQELDLDVPAVVAASERPLKASGAAGALRRPASRRRSAVPVERRLEGFVIEVDPSLLEGEHAELGRRALSMLQNHLQRIAILVPPAPLRELRRVAIRLERHHPELDNMQYHPSRGWLERHGHDPSLVRKVHIPRAAELLSRQQLLKHPAVVLHELAHAYHHQVLGFDDPDVFDAFRAARDGGGYRAVLDHAGRTVRHYALTNHMEYFAEATEAYLYRNDFFPFVAAELAAHDARGHALMQQVWGRR